MKYSKELKAGLVVIITIICFWMLFQYLKGRDVFTSGNVYYINYDNVAGLQASKAVSINGFKVGKVEAIEPVYKDNGMYSYTVKIRVKDDYIFNKSTIAQIFSPDLMGGKEIRLLLSDKPPIALDGDYLKGTIMTSLTDQLGDEMGPISSKISSVMSQLDSTLVVTETVMKQVEASNLTGTIGNASNMFSSFRTTSDKAAQLLDKNNQEINALLKDANFIMASINQTIAKYGQVAEKVNNLDIEKNLNDLHVTMGKVDKLLDNLNNNNGSLNLMLTDPSLYNNLNETSKNLNSLLISLKEDPKKYFNISVFGKK